MKGFATESATKKIKGKDGKVIETTFVHGLFGSLLCISVEKKVYLCQVLKYPLTLYPKILCQADESIIESPKSSLMKYIESKMIYIPSR